MTNVLNDASTQSPATVELQNVETLVEHPSLFPDPPLVLSIPDKHWIKLSELGHWIVCIGMTESDMLQFLDTAQGKVLASHQIQEQSNVLFLLVVYSQFWHVLVQLIYRGYRLGRWCADTTGPLTLVLMTELARLFLQMRHNPDKMDTRREINLLLRAVNTLGTVFRHEDDFHLRWSTLREFHRVPYVKRLTTEDRVRIETLFPLKPVETNQERFEEQLYLGNWIQAQGLLRIHTDDIQVSTLNLNFSHSLMFILHDFCTTGHTHWDFVDLVLQQSTFYDPDCRLSSYIIETAGYFDEVRFQRRDPNWCVSRFYTRFLDKFLAVLPAVPRVCVLPMEPNHPLYFVQERLLA